jgi:hypothetical protein
MVDPQPVNHAPLDPLEHQTVRVFKNVLFLHPQAGQRVDVEEPAIGQFLPRRAPERKSIILTVQQQPHGGRIGVDLDDRVVDCPGHVRLLLA